MKLFYIEIYDLLCAKVELFIFGLILLFVAYKLPINREKIQEFWTKEALNEKVS